MRPGHWTFAKSVRACLAIATSAMLAGAALAEVKTSTTTRYHSVPGTTAKAVVSYMLRNPLPGDHGAAFANIRPSYHLDIATQVTGGVCRARAVDVSISFRLTLPAARDADRMSKATRAAWNGFAAFARRHEEWHRQSYTGCAKTFETRARRQTAPTCAALNAQIRRQFSRAKSDCEAVQLAFDRAEKPRLRALRLFQMAGY